MGTELQTKLQTEITDKDFGKRKQQYINKNYGTAIEKVENLYSHPLVVTTSQDELLELKKREGLRKLSTNFCHIFVVQGEDFNGNCFTLERSRTFTRDNPLNINHLRTLSDADIVKFKKYPALFLDTN
jgi:hypothetical protein